MLKLDISVVSSKINFSATKGSKKIKILERNEFGEIQVCLFGGLVRSAVRLFNYLITSQCCQRSLLDTPGA